MLVLWYAINIDERLAEISSRSGLSSEQRSKVVEVLTTLSKAKVPGRA
jgi:hypothetical protein